MRWDYIEQLIQKPFDILVEHHSAKPKYFLLQNNTSYSISAKQYERIRLLKPLVEDTSYTTNFTTSIEIRLYKCK